jgi:hypothetical protein
VTVEDRPSTSENRLPLGGGNAGSLCRHRQQSDSKRRKVGCHRPPRAEASSVRTLPSHANDWLPDNVRWWPKSGRRVRRCLLLGVDRTYRGHHETESQAASRCGRSRSKAPSPVVTQDGRCKPANNRRRAGRARASRAVQATLQKASSKPPHVGRLSACWRQLAAHTLRTHGAPTTLEKGRHA